MKKIQGVARATPSNPSSISNKGLSTPPNPCYTVVSTPPKPCSSQHFLWIYNALPVAVAVIISASKMNFLYALSTSAFSILALRKVKKVQPSTSKDDSSSSIPSTTDSLSSSKQTVSSSEQAVTTPPKPYSSQLVQFLYTALPVAAAVSISASKLNDPWAQPLHTILMIFTTVTGYVFGAQHLPVRTLQQINGFDYSISYKLLSLLWILHTLL